MLKKSITLFMAHLIAIFTAGCGSGGDGSVASKPDISTPNEQTSSYNQTLNQLKIRNAVIAAASPQFRTNSLFSYVEPVRVYRGVDGFNTKRPADLIEEFESRKVQSIRTNIKACHQGDITETGQFYFYHLNDFNKTDRNDCTFLNTSVLEFYSGSDFKTLSEFENIDTGLNWNLDPEKDGRYTKIAIYDDVIDVLDEEIKDKTGVFNRKFTSINGEVVLSGIVRNKSAISKAVIKNYTLIRSQSEVAAGTPFLTIDKSAQTLKTELFTKTLAESQGQSQYSVDGDFTIDDVKYTVTTVTPFGKSDGNEYGELKITIGKQKINVLRTSPGLAKYTIDSDGNGVTDTSFEDLFYFE